MSSNKCILFNISTFFFNELCKLTEDNQTYAYKNFGSLDKKTINDVDL